MRTRSRQSKSSRQPKSPNPQKSLVSRLKRYLPWAAVICASAYLPPKVFSTNYSWNGGDADSTWNLAGNWTPSGIPTAAADTATFDTNFTLTRTISYDVPTSTQIRSISYADPRPSGTGSQLNIVAATTQTFQLSNTTGLTLNPAQNNVLSLAPSAVANALFTNVSGQNGQLIKSGLGTAIISGANSYTGATTLNNGILQVSVLANGGAASNIGQSTNVAANLVFNTGTLKYTGAAVTTDRSFTISDDILLTDDSVNKTLLRAGATIDASGTGVVVFNSLSSLGSNSNGGLSQTLVLRGTSGTATSTGTANQLDAPLHDGAGGAPFSLLKTDTGTWKITNRDSDYSGPTIVQRGILSLDYTKGTPNTSRLSDNSTLVLGGLPGGGTLDMIGTTLVEEFTNSSAPLVVKQGANLIQGPNNGGILVVPNLRELITSTDPANAGGSYRLKGGIIRLSTTNLIETNEDTPTGKGIYNGWITIGDDYITNTAIGNPPTLFRAAVFSGYRTSGGNNVLPSAWGPDDNININLSPSQALDSRQNIFGYTTINSLRFQDNPTPNKLLVLQSGDDGAGNPDPTQQPTVLNIATGGLIHVGGSGNTQIKGGVITSGGQIDGGSNGEIFANIRGNNLFLSSAIEDYVDPNVPSNVVSVALTKYGTATLILHPDATNVYASNFSGNVFVNEGTLLVRTKDGLGNTDGIFLDHVDYDTDPSATGKTIVNGGNLEFQGVDYIGGRDSNNLPGKETVEIYSGTIQATQGRGGFGGIMKSMNPDALATFNIATWLDIDAGATLSGISGISKTGAGTLVVNSAANFTPSADPATGAIVAGVGDINLTAGNSVWNGTILLSNGTVNVTGGNHAINNSLGANRLVVSAGNFALNKNNQSFPFDVILSGGTTLLGSALQPSNQQQTFGGSIAVSGGTLVLNSNATFNGTVKVTAGSLSELASVIPGSIPTVRFANTTPGSVVFGPASGTAVTTTLQFNTIFDSAPVINPGSTLTLTGIGTTTFNAGVSVTSTGTFNLVNAVLNGAFTVNNGTQSFNGLNVVNGLLTINAGTFQQTGTRRGIIGGTLVGGSYGVIDNFKGGIVINNTSTTALAPQFSGANIIGTNGTGADVTVAGFSPGFTFVNAANSSTETFFNNQQTFGGTLRLTGGRVTIQNGAALGTGVGTRTDLATTETGGVVITGEKSVLLLQRGVAVGDATAINEDIVIGNTTGYLAGIVIAARGTGATGTTATITGGGGSGAAYNTVTLSSGAVTAIAFGTNGSVGTGYTSAPTITVAGSTGGNFVPVLGGPVVRSNDQHNIWNGNLVLDNVNATTHITSPAIPVISVNGDDSLNITGNIYGSATTVTSGGSRYLTTAIPGGPYNSVNGFIILDGEVRDVAAGPATGLNVLRTDWGGNSELTVQVNKNWNANGLISLSSGMMRYTSTTNTNFFASGVTTNSAATPNIEFSVAANNFTSIGWNALDQNIGYFLTKPGQVLNTSYITVHNGNTDKIANNGTRTGNDTIGGENTSGTVTIGSYDSNNKATITLETDTGSTGQIRDLRLFANGTGGGTAGGTVDIKAAIVQTGSGSGSVTKIGDGTVRLLGSSATPSTYGRLNVMAGTLEIAGLDTFSNATSARISASATVTFGGGTLRVQGPSTSISNVSTGAVTFAKGNSAVQVIDNGATVNTVTLGSTGFSRSSGGTVRFSEVTATVPAGNKANIVLGNNTAAIKNVPMGFAVYGTTIDATSSAAAPYFAQVNGTTAIDLYNPAGYADTGGSDNPTAWPAGGHVSELNTGAGFNSNAVNGSPTMGSIRFGATGATAGTINIGAGATLTVNDGILLASTAGGQNRAINGGTLRGGATVNGLTAGDLIIQNYGGNGVTGPSLTINSIIGDSAGGSAKGVTIAGDGLTVFTNPANSYTGTTWVNGWLQVGSNGALGNIANPIFVEGGTLQFTDDVSLSSGTTNRAITVYGDRSTIAIDAGKTLNIPGQIKSDGNVLGGNYSGVNVFSGDLVLGGGGTIRQVIDNSFNPFYGQIIVSGGTRYVVESNTSAQLGATSNTGIISYGYLDGTVIENGSTLELHPTATGGYNISDFLTLSGAGQNGLGAIHLNRPAAGFASLVDAPVGVLGGVTLAGDTTIFVDDSAERFATSATVTSIAGVIGQFSFNDNIFDGGGKALTKTGPGQLRFVNDRIQNLPTINVLGGEVKFESGITGVVGNGAGLTPAALVTNYYTGTSQINVGGGSTAGFALNPRVWFSDARGVHTTNISLNGGFLLVNSADAPLPSVNFGGTINLTGAASTNGWEVAGTTRTNPTTVFGPITGTGGFTKIGTNELQLVNSGNSFQGDMIITRGGQSVGSPSVGLYDGGRLTGTGTHSIIITNDGSLHLDNQNSLDANSANDNQLDRIANNIGLQLGGIGRFRLIGNNTAASSETLGALLIHPGDSAVEMDPGVLGTTYRNVGLTFSSYARETGGVVQFRLLGKGLTLDGTGQPTNEGKIVINSIAPQFLSGSGAVNTTTRNVIIGAFGGATTNAFSALPANTSIPVGLNNAEQTFVARNFLTLDAGGVVRPLRASEMFSPTITATPNDPNNEARDVFIFASNTTPNQNLLLAGGFGPFTSYVTENIVASEGLFQLPGADNSRRQDSTYLLNGALTINSLALSPQATEFISTAGNRIVLDLAPTAVLTINSGMILGGAYGTLQNSDAIATDSTDQRTYIRGGTLEFGSKEIIIHNTSAAFREGNGTWGNNNGDMNIYSTLSGTGGLTKSGPSLVQLGGLGNTYSGTTTITDGILRIVGDGALGRSQLLIETGIGEFRMARGVQVGTHAAPITMRITGLGGGVNNILTESGNNYFHGDIQLDSGSAGGESVFNVQFMVNNPGKLTLDGSIYGLDSDTGGTSMLNDTQRGRNSRQLVLNSLGGVFEFLGDIRDTPTGPISSPVTSDNEAQVIRSFIGNQANQEGNFYLHKSWNSAGSISFRSGATVLLADAGDNFYTTTAASRLNPLLTRSRPIMNDGGSQQDVAIVLTTPGQGFNSPNLQVANSTADNSTTLAGSNTTGTVAYMGAGVNDSLFDATQRVSVWDRVVRLYEPTGGNMDIYSRITDSGGAGGLAKIGAGTVTMRGMPSYVAGWSATTSSVNDFKKQIVVAGGNLVLDYATNNIGALSGGTASNGWGTTAVNLILAGGRIELQGDSDNNTAQSWGTSAAGVPGLTTRPGASEIVVGSGGNGKTMTLTIGGNFIQLPSGGATGTTTQPNATLGKNGGTVNFVNLTPATASIVLSATGSNTANTTSGGLMNSTASQVMGAWATFGTARGQASDFASKNAAGAVVAFTGYTVQDNPGSWASGQHVSENLGFGTTAAPVAAQVKTIKLGAPGAATVLNLPVGFKLGTATVVDQTAADEGAILVPSNVTALKTIQGGTLQTSSSSDLYIHNYGTGGLNIASQITGTQNLVANGPGTTRLTGFRNNYTGNTYVSGGVLDANSVADGQADVASMTVFQTPLLDANNNPVLDGSGNPVLIPTNVATMTSTTGIAVGQNLSSSLFPAGSVVTGVGTVLIGTTATPAVEFSQTAPSTGTAAGSFGNALGNTATATIFLTGGTLRASTATTPTTPLMTIRTARPITLGGTGGTFDVVDPGVTLQLDGVVTTTQSAAIQTTTAQQTRNTYVGDLIKTGAGNLALNGANTYFGITDVRQGVLTILTNNGGVLGTTFGDLDSTIIRSGATLRFSQTAGSLTSPEWITFENGSTIDIKMTASAQQVLLDGVLTLGSLVDPGNGPRDQITIRYTGDNVKAGLGPTATFTPTAISGNTTVDLNNSGGYLRGSGTIIKNGVYGPVVSATNNATNGQGGILRFDESNPDWTGGLVVNGGRVLLRSFGLPLGSGTVPVILGNNKSNFFSTAVGGTKPTEEVFPEANLFFQPENTSLPNGGSTSTGSPDNVIGNYRILQDIIISKPARTDAANPLTQTFQLKQIGVTNQGNSLDAYNLDGRLIVDDDFNFYLDGALLNDPSLGEVVQFNVNNSIITGHPDVNLTYSGNNGPGTTNQLPFRGNITTRLNVSKANGGAELGVYNDLTLNLNLNGDNSLFSGGYTIGNPQVLFQNVGVSNPDANHVLVVGNDKALNENNQVQLLDEGTLRINGHTITMGSLVTQANTALETPASNGLHGALYNATNAQNVALTNQSFTTADIPRQIFDPLDLTYQNTPTIRSIVENASTTAATLTINQTVNSHWEVFIRDGVTPTGAASQPLSIVKTGDAIAQIDTPNQYSGTTTVTGGFLQVQNQVDSATGTGSVTVGQKGGLSGNGIIFGHVTSSGTIAPGEIDIESGVTRSGSLVLQNGIDMHAGSQLLIDILGSNEGEISNGYDTLALSSGFGGGGTFTLDGNLSILLNLDKLRFTPTNSDPVSLAGGDRFTIIDTDHPLQFLAGSSLNFYGNPTGINKDITYFYGDGDTQIFRVILTDNGHDLTLVAVPEPGTASTIACGVGMLLGLQRFRRRSRVTA